MNADVATYAKVTPIEKATTTTYATNLGCASDSPFAQTITARVYSAANVLLGTLSFDMNPWGWRQVGVDVGVTDGTMVISSTQRAVCFGVVVDNVSNDGTYQIAVPD